MLKILLKRILIVFLLICFIGSPAIVSYILEVFINTNSAVYERTEYMPVVTPWVAPVQKKSEIGLPVRLVIPVIGVDSTIVDSGITPEGAMGAPKNPEEVAWFNFGRRPGEEGSAVLAGHYGWKNVKSAAFDNLYQLRAGDKIYIEDERGIMTTFIVKKTRRYNPEDDASSVFASYDGKAHLNLITCEGIWNKDSKSYSKRLVVFAEKE